MSRRARRAESRWVMGGVVSTTGITGKIRTTGAAGAASALALLFLMLFAGRASAMPTAGDAPPSISSDKADYTPGEHVTLSGSGWGPGEAIHISVNDDTGNTWSRDTDVTADDFGSMHDEFDLPNWFVASYSVKATGASGATATTTFTDGNLTFGVATSDTVTPSGAWTVNYEKHNGSSTCNDSSPQAG